MEIHIFKGHQAIDGSPLIVYAFDPAAVHLIEFPKKIIVNRIHRFIIDPTKAGKGSLKIAIKGKFKMKENRFLNRLKLKFHLSRSEQSNSSNNCAKTVKRTRGHRVQSDGCRLRKEKITFIGHFAFLT